ncbi:MAG: triose-phosphate isomerase [Rhodothalassiaceae bacterium]
MSKLKPLIAGNWKMNGLMSDLSQALAVARGLMERPVDADVLICPPATLVAAMAADLRGMPVMVGGQDCHAETKGAHTGDIAAEMLKDAGASHVILGHSERRADHGESDDMVRQKTLAAFRAGLGAIVCVGESLAEREAGEALARVLSQLRASIPASADAARLVIAYEPIWAIGSGRTPGPEDIIAMHAAIRAHLGDMLPDGKRIRILYGGSVNPRNAADILRLPEVNGALVGGASLKSADFGLILDALRQTGTASC